PDSQVQRVRLVLRELLDLPVLQGHLVRQGQRALRARPVLPDPRERQGRRVGPAQQPHNVTGESIMQKPGRFVLYVARRIAFTAIAFALLIGGATAADRNAIVEIARLDKSVRPVQLLVSGTNLLGPSKSCEMPSLSLGALELQITKATPAAITAV